MAPTGAAGAALRGRRRARTSRSGPSPGGARGIRTPDLLIANETRYQLRHSPECATIVTAGRRPRNLAARDSSDTGWTIRRPGRAPAPIEVQQDVGGLLGHAPAARRRWRTASRSMGGRRVSPTSAGTEGRAEVGRAGTGAEGPVSSSSSSMARLGAEATRV